MQLSRRVLDLEPSPTLAIQARAKALKAAGEAVFSLAAGEPDFKTPEHIRRAATRAMEAGLTGYTPSAGVPELREAVRRQYREKMGLSYEDNQVTVGCGAKQCLLNAFLSLLEAGTSAIVQAPYWVSYPEQIKLCGAKPVILPPPKSGFGFDVGALAKAIDKSTRVVVLNSPCNPTGQVIEESDLKTVAELALKHDLTVVSDDIYDQLIYDGKKLRNIVQVEPKMGDRTVLVNGVSKTYSMTGWRLGYAVGPAVLIGAMRKIQDQSTSNATTFVQYGAIEALASPPEIVETMVKSFDERRRRMVALLSEVPGVLCPLPAGAFYAFADFSAVLKKSHQGKQLASSMRLAELLLEEERVAVIPGEAFGAPGHLRFSFAASMNTIEEGLARVKRFVEKVS
jgi:aspartate aminotransferase